MGTLLGRVRDLVLPPLCLGCSCVVETADTVCVSCWSDFTMIGPSVCGICGAPFPHDQGAPLCATCAGHTPPFARARGAVIYNAGCASMILAFKYGDRTEAAALFARMMIAAAQDLIEQADVLVPVPLDRRRLFHRRYNQAGLIAQEISKQQGTPVLLDAVERIKPTPGQGDKKTKISAAQRRRAVRGAFRVRPAFAEQLTQRRILVVDDVYTSGATVWSLARALNGVGAGAVDVLTFARVVRE